MAKPADCAHCQKTATIHLTQIIDGKITKLDFCEDCPHQKEVADPAAFSLAQILASHDAAAGGGVDPALMRTSCEQCGMTLGAFKKTGRLGCAHCYDQFRSVITQILPQMHGSSCEHTGKRPAAMLERMANERRVAELEDLLKEAIRTEAYEEAARLRDQLRALEQAAAAAEALEAVAQREAAAAAEEDAAESTAMADSAADSATAKDAVDGTAAASSEHSGSSNGTADDRPGSDNEDDSGSMQRPEQK